MAENGFIDLESQAGSVSIDPSVGNLRGLTLRHGDSEIQPLHTAHWVGDREVRDSDNLLMVEKKLSGDFFCAPFAANDVEPGPAHGWSANSDWEVVTRKKDEVELQLKRRVCGATIRKQVRLSQNSPILYQTHLIEDGNGKLTCAHHPMVKLQGKGRFFTSPKKVAVTPATPLEPGRNMLACPEISSDLTAFPASNGSTVDLTRLPIASRHEDFATLVESGDSGLGWSAVLREEEKDIVFFLKNSAVLPVTMLWHSNGGRDYWPWNSKHTGVLGIEDGCAAGAEGHKASLTENPISIHGVPTCLHLGKGRVHRINHAIGTVCIPEGWSGIEDIQLESQLLAIEGSDGSKLKLPFTSGFLQGGGKHGNC